VKEGNIFERFTEVVKGVPEPVEKVRI